jgi:effector-binding domain-containing protein
MSLFLLEIIILAFNLIFTNTMKLLKYLFYIILVLFIGGAIYFGIKDGKYDISSTKEMDVPLGIIYRTVNEYRTWQDWGPWMELDPDVKLSYADTTYGAGASYSWDSEHPEVGMGSMRTISVEENRSIDQEIIFVTPLGDSKSDVYWKFDPVENSARVNVTWGMKGEQTFLEKVFMAFQSEPFDQTLKSMFDKGLSNLETHTQNEMKEYTIVVDGVKQHGGGYYMYTTSASKISELGSKMAPMFGLVSDFMNKNNITFGGMPFTVYNQIDEVNGTVIFSTCIPVNERVITPEGSSVLCGYLKPSRALKSTLSGNYINLGEAYEKAKSFMKENNLSADATAQMFEIYANDPGLFPNPAEWITEIYIPLEYPLKLNNQ